MMIQILLLGNGQLPVIPGTVNMIQIPDKYLTNMQIEDNVFPKEMTVKNLSEYSNRVILCPKNEDCLKLNDNILNSRFIDESIQYISIDSIVSDSPEEISNYPLEFLHSLTPPGLPPNKLLLKIGSIVMCLRNLNSKIGLCNGTRLVVTHIRTHYIRCHMLSVIRKLF